MTELVSSCSACKDSENRECSFSGLCAVCFVWSEMNVFWRNFGMTHVLFIDFIFCLFFPFFVLCLALVSFKHVCAEFEVELQFGCQWVVVPFLIGSLRFGLLKNVSTTQRCLFFGVCDIDLRLVFCTCYTPLFVAHFVCEL
eukprot:m.190922 g.190922  ORF g.190922 m.190922 type:complete len:141 (+) comp14831_c0_seq1:420-842(+)